MYRPKFKSVFALLTLLFSQVVWSQPFEGLSEAIERGEFGSLKSVLVSQHGEVLYEEYFRGAQPGDLQVMNSVTKSVGSALIGIAHRQGKLQLGQNLEYFFGDRYPMLSTLFRDKRMITAEHVLQQRHGIEWDEWSVDYGDPSNPTYEMIVSNDWYHYVLSRPIDSAPGETFAYSTGASTLMSRMVRIATGMGPHEFAVQELFGPLGINHVHWEGSDGQGGGNGFTNWPNPDHDPSLGYSLWLRPSDMLKLGELYLNRGEYSGRRILDRSWVEASTVPYSNPTNSEYFADRPGSGYGYQWWVLNLTDGHDRAWPGFYASGWGRQHILVFPDLDLVVVSTADDYDYDGPGIGSILRTVILPELSPALDNRFDGAWYDPDTDGQGLTLEVLDEGQRLIGFWYTYGQDGGRRWFTFDGEIEGSEAEVTILETSGGVFLQGDPVERAEWGRGRFSVVDCNNLQFDIDAEEVLATVPLFRLTGSCVRP